MTGLGGWSLEGLGKLVLSYTVKKQQPGGMWQNSSGYTDHRPLQLMGPLRMAGPVLQGPEKSGLDPSVTVSLWESEAKLWGLPLTSWVTLAKERVVLVLPLKWE